MSSRSSLLSAGAGPKADALVTDDHALDAATFLKSSRFDIKKADNFELVVDGLFKDRIDQLKA